MLKSSGSSFLGIAVLLPGWYSSETTGGGKTILESVKAFQRFGASALILAPANCKDYHIHKSELNKHVYLRLFNTPSVFRFVFFPFVISVRFAQISLKYIKQIKTFIQQQNMTIILSNSDIISTLFSISIKRVFSHNRKIVIVFPWYHIHHGLGGVLTLCALRFVGHADILYTESTINNIVSAEKPSAHVFEAKSFVAGVGIDYAKYQKEASRTKKIEYDACFIGRIHPSKGVFDLIKAWQIVVTRYPKSKLAVVGEGLPMHERELGDLIKQFGLQQNISRLGFVSEKQKINVIFNSKVLVHPSYGECIPLVFLESMVCKTPIVTYYLPTYVDIGKYVFSVKLGDILGLAESILNFIEEKNYKNHVSRLNEAKNYALSSDWKIIAERLLDKSEQIVYA
jgi:glycosyltransferase involved in cell wall biosynthesis